jgi:hypothetical protein
MFLPLTIVTVEGRTILAVECACGVRLDRGVLVEFSGTWMLCHQDCLDRVNAED